MKNRARVATLVGCVSLFVTGGAAFLQGCGGDDTVVNHPDAEAGSDNFVPPADVIGADVSDVNVIDSPLPTDAGCDASVVQQFANDMIANMCNRYSACCFPDAATFDQAQCEAFWHGGPGGFNQVNRDLLPTTFNSCTLVLDPTAATSCLAGLKTFSCPSMAATEFANITNNCYAAVQGTTQVGQPCTDSVECQRGNFCSPNVDGGSSCQPLETDGGDCTTINGVVVNSNVACAYRNNYNETMRCNRAGSKKCEAPLADGTKCIFNWDCKSQVCGDNKTCGSVTTTSDPNFICPLFKKDGG